LLCGPDWFAEPIEEWPAEVINVGFPLSYNERFDNLPPDLMEDLLGDEPPVVITGGTSKTIRPEFIPYVLRLADFPDVRVFW